MRCDEAVYYSVRQLPELVQLSEQERLAVLMHFWTYHTSVLRFRYSEVGMVAFITLAEIAGFVGGWFYWRGFWGSVAGAVLAMLLAMGTFHLIDLYTTLPKLRRFLHTERGKLVLENAKQL